MEIKTITQDRIIVAGDACTRDFIAQLLSEQETASYTAKSLYRIRPADVFDIDMCDKLVRAQRNAQALATLLSLAADTAQYLNNGLCEILHAFDAQDVDKVHRLVQKAKKEREKDKKHQEYLRAKKRKQEALAKTL